MAFVTGDRYSESFKMIQSFRLETGRYVRPARRDPIPVLGAQQRHLAYSPPLGRRDGLAPRPAFVHAEAEIAGGIARALV
ncbi:MAG: hypothetical protein BWY06_03466 [Candidatus Latescibacteria bacterium ADurb.Bin168]|nr:MAG: hypothetical protein BWY06_03466 [Candidatus Latescibacteria bacterium ADurb.Bin168]